jgi:predicted nucleic acid-binding Zn ribbon protein
MFVRLTGDPAVNTTPASEYPPGKWPRTSRLWKPYTFHPIRVVEGDTPTAIPNPDQSERDRQLAVHHLKGPIHPHLLRLVPGSHDSIVDFAEKLGLDELILWGMSLGDDYLTAPWLQLRVDMRHLDDGVATIPAVHLLEAWGFGSQTEAFAKEQTRLHEAYQYATDYGADETVLFLRDYWRVTHPEAGLESWSFPNPEMNLVTWPVEPIDPMGDVESLALVEAPAHIFARAWLELYDSLQASGAPKICPRCGTPFLGVRKGQTYCSEECQETDYGRRRRSDYRREYERMYQRMRRGAITRDEFADWKKRQGKE